MTKRMLTAAALVLGSIAAQGALAQAASSPTREEVKAQIPADRTKDAQISGERMPPAKQWKPAATGNNQPKSREEVRKEAADSIHKGKAPVKAGEGDSPVSETRGDAASKPMKKMPMAASGAQ